MGKVKALQHDKLSEAPSTPSIVRKLAFKDENVRVLRSQTKPGIVSGWHSHDFDVYGYMASGSMRLEFGPGGKESVLVKERGFFNVPSHTIHREINPSKKNGQEVILFLSGSGEMVVNVDGPEKG